MSHRFDHRSTHDERARHPAAGRGHNPLTPVGRRPRSAHVVEVRPLGDERLLLPAWALTCRSCSPGAVRLLGAWHDPIQLVAALRAHDQDPSAQPHWLPLLRA